MTCCKTLLYTLPLTLLCAQSCLALDDGSVITEEDIFADLPVVTGVSRISQLLSRAPASVTIIDRPMIEASGAQSWVDLFRLVPGMQAYSVNANRHGISYHSIGHEFPSHMEVRVDGRSVYEPIFSTVNWNSLAINLADIDRIEVIRGTNAPSDGSNAFFGAINIITREPVQDRGWAIRGTYGSRGTREMSARYNGSLGNLDYRWSVGYQQNLGFTSLPKTPVNDGQRLRHSEFRGTWTPDTTNTIDFHAGHSNSDVGYGDADSIDEYSPARFNQQFQSVKWRQLLAGEDELQLHLYRNKLVGDNSVPVGRLSELAVAAGLAGDIDTAIAILNSFGISDGLFVGGFRHIESERYDLELSHSLDRGDHFRAIWGAGVRHEMLDAEALFEPGGRVSQMGYRLFGNLEWQPASHWVINAGIIAEHNDIVDTIASPRLGVNYLINDNISVRFTAARGNRSPSLLEANEFNIDSVSGQVLVAIRRATDDLREEKLDSYDLGFIANYPERGMTVDLRLYREKVRDGLEQFAAPFATSPLSDDDDIAVIDNILRSNRRGAELQVQYRPNASTQITAQYAYTHLTGGPTPFDVPFGNYNPSHTAGLLLGKQLTGGLTASTSIYFQDDVQWRGGGEHHNSFTRVDAKLSYPFELSGMNGQIALVGQNIGSGSYPDFNQNNRFNSRYFLQFELALP